MIDAYRIEINDSHFNLILKRFIIFYNLKIMGSDLGIYNDKYFLLFNVN